ncbi:MAG: deoxyribodipyrimidine photolyase [Pirellulales bacterium]
MARTSIVPSLRIRTLVDAPPQSQRDWVLYWMTAFRRPHSNFALDRALEWARDLGKPLVILEAVRQHYPWACDRFHRFLIDGMIDNQEAFRDHPVLYYPYLEPKPGKGHGLARALADQACVLVSDDFPCFFHPTLYERIVARYPVRVELIDSNGILPMRATDRTFTVAHSYRRYMQKEVVHHWNTFPKEKPFASIEIPRLHELPTSITRRWPCTDLQPFKDRNASLSRFSIDHEVAPTDDVGGHREAQKRLQSFLRTKLDRYDEDRNEPDELGSSRLSPYLHFGHISAHQIFRSILHRVEWVEANVGKPNGKVDGFWNAGRSAEAYLDQLLTWREIGFNMCWREPNYDRYESLPAWAQQTLQDHARDRRPWVYELEQFENATTHDPLWNAAQRQLVRDGIIHNYLRMLWGKKILHWSASPQEALRIMIHLNNKYALDGRDPNSYSGIFWVLGRYDRAWGPEREIFGKIRYMTSESTASKWHVKKYLQLFGGE